MNAFKSVNQINRLKDRYHENGSRLKVRRAVKTGIGVVFKISPRFCFGKARVVQTADMIDISTNGLKVQYTATDKWSLKFDHISIVDARGKSIINDIYCKRITDCQIDQLQNGNCTRICGLKFQKLSGKQKYRINNFIRENTVDPKDLARWHVQFA